MSPLHHTSELSRVAYAGGIGPVAPDEVGPERPWASSAASQPTRSSSGGFNRCSKPLNLGFFNYLMDDTGEISCLMSGLLRREFDKRRR